MKFSGECWSIALTTDQRGIASGGPGGVKFWQFEFIPDDEIPNPSCYYMPQHAVIRRDENGTKLRPVFDLSTKGPNGVSCNDIMVAGPALQPDIVGLTVRWRR